MSRTDRCIAAAGALLAATAASALELVDPMQPPVVDEIAAVETESAIKPGAWRLGAIRIEADRRSAMINGRMVAVGDQIDGARVVAIAPGSVEIAVGNENSSLSLLKHDIKIRPAAAR